MNMAQRFAIDAVNEVQPLDGGGAFASGKLNVASFEPARAEMTMAKPSPAIGGPGGLA